ncbi:bestrophin family protein [Rapidithrix thailandica]|uniref:Bestrophin family protein n=1 Tax=Rapidithrix thailandica TaxID=413964 RepID=A0AAW9SB96_9BACT
MIIYNTKNWAKAFYRILPFTKEYSSRTLNRATLIILIYNTLVTLIQKDLVKEHLEIDNIYFNFIGTVLGFVLVFRLNTAYGKWWEGRQLWGSLVNTCRTIAAYAHTVLPEKDRDQREYFALQVTNFPFALKGHLRQNFDWEDFEEPVANYKQTLQKVSHVPFRISADLNAKVESLHKAGVFSDMDKYHLARQVQQLNDIMGGCERIRNTPLPYAHSSFIKKFLIFFCAALPFGLLDSFGYSTILLASMVSYAMSALEIISEELEEPFGKDPDDLPLNQLSTTIRKNVYEILEQNRAVREVKKVDSVIVY